MRRVFFERLEEESRRLKRTGGTLSLLLIDVDHFKEINDNYGHDIGDSALQDISMLISACLRETDLAARIGGGGIRCVPAGYSSGRRLWRGTAHLPIHRTPPLFCPAKEGQPLSCTVSVGIASSSNVLPEEMAQLYKQADVRLYIAKNSGRNQVSVDETTLIH